MIYMNQPNIMKSTIGNCSQNQYFKNTNMQTTWINQITKILKGLEVFWQLTIGRRWLGCSGSDGRWSEERAREWPQWRSERKEVKSELKRTSNLTLKLLK